MSDKQKTSEERFDRWYKDRLENVSLMEQHHKGFYIVAWEAQEVHYTKLREAVEDMSEALDRIRLWMATE